MRLGITEGHGLDQCVQAQARNHPARQPAVDRMGMAVLDPHRNEIQGHLGKKPAEDQCANRQVMAGRGISRGVVQLWQKVQQGERKQVGADKSVEQFDVAGLVQLEEENAKAAQEDAGKEE